MFWLATWFVLVCGSVEPLSELDATAYKASVAELCGENPNRTCLATVEQREVSASVRRIVATVTGHEALSDADAVSVKELAVAVAIAFSSESSAMEYPLCGLDADCVYGNGGCGHNIDCASRCADKKGLQGWKFRRAIRCNDYWKARGPLQLWPANVTDATKQNPNFDPHDLDDVLAWLIPTLAQNTRENDDPARRGPVLRDCPSLSKRNRLLVALARLQGGPRMKDPDDPKHQIPRCRLNGYGKKAREALQSTF